MELIYLVAGIIILLAFAVMAVCGKMEKKISPYLIFAIVDIACGIGILIFAIYDFNTSVGEFAGFFGELALKIGEPIVVVLLIIDIIIWKVNSRRKA